MSAFKKKRRVRRRNYSEAFKREAVATYEASGKSHAEICRLLDISCVSVLKNWRVLYGSSKTALKRTPPMVSDDIFSETILSADKKRIAALEVEVKHLKQALGNQVMLSAGVALWRFVRSIT